jgi:hypothetical protein
MVSSCDVSPKRKDDIIIDFINDVQSEEETGKSWGAQNHVLMSYKALCPWFKLRRVSHYKAKRKRASEQQEKANIMAASNKR